MSIFQKTLTLLLSIIIGIIVASILAYILYFLTSMPVFIKHPLALFVSTIYFLYAYIAILLRFKPKEPISLLRRIIKAIILYIVIDFLRIFLVVISQMAHNQ